MKPSMYKAFPCAWQIGRVLLILLVGRTVVLSQQRGGVWRSAPIPNRPPEADWLVRPLKSHAFQLDRAAIDQALSRAPREFTPAAAQPPAEILLPMPDGTLARFQVSESPIMAPELAAKFPELETYSGQGIDDSTATVRFDLTPAGFHG